MRNALSARRFDWLFAACFLLVLAAYLWGAVPVLLHSPVDWPALLDWPRLMGLVLIPVAYAMRRWSRAAREGAEPGSS